jgi:hypothetical protein
MLIKPAVEGGYMDRDALARAFLAACATLALLAPGFLLSRGALSAPEAQSQHPEKYLPLILGRGLRPEELTATAQAAPFATATAQAATLTAAATTTATATATTSTTATATTTPSPTSDALATAQLQIANNTGFPLTFTLEGPTNASGEVQPNQSWLISIRPGNYKLTAETHCRTNLLEFPIASGQSKQVGYTCP